MSPIVSQVPLHLFHSSFGNVAFRVFSWGDSDGHFAVAESDGSVVPGFALLLDASAPAADRSIVASPFQDGAGTVFVGNRNGKVFKIDEATATVATTYSFGTGLTVSEITWQWTTGNYLVATTDGTDVCLYSIAP